MHWFFWGWVAAVVVYAIAMGAFAWVILHDDPRMRAEDRGKR